MMVLEYVSNGNLRDLLRDHRPESGVPSPLSPYNLINFGHQVAAGMQFLALNRVVHRDLAW